ncbi:MAG: D-aminoacylase [Spirochaetia bacterium]|nr:D-aminoacylase [Spirochaetia bacterium]
MDVDLLIENATIVDGYWPTPYLGSVAISGETIEIVSSCRQSLNAKKVIDAKGKHLIPGIIDIHSHSDLVRVSEEQFIHKIAMGITTEVIGNCGIGPFPALQEGALGSLNYDVLGSRRQFASFDEYKQAFLKAPPSTNIVALQAHAPLRIEVMKERVHQKATKEEIKQMVTLLETSFEQGVRGFSSGLYYDPCLYADREELLALLSVVKKHNGIFSVHHREEGDGVIESIQEVIELATHANVSLQISHLKAIGEVNQSKVPHMLSLIEEAHEGGLDISFDQYPYEWGATSLSSLLPPYVLSMPNEKRTLLLQSKEGREEIRKAIETTNHYDSIIHLCGFDNITLLSYDADPSIEGMTLSEIARMRNVDNWDAFFTLILNNSNSSLMSDITQSRASIEMIMAHPLGFFSTDAIYSGRHFHRRSTHAVQDLFDNYYIKKEVLSIAEHVKRMSVNPAKKLGLLDRGMIMTGYKGDLLLIDLKEKAHVDMVIVNGKIAYEDDTLRGDYTALVL